MIRVVNPSYKIEHASIEPQMIEAAGRTCYKSEDRITHDSAERFARMIVRRGHESVLEHSLLTVRFVCSRAISHEIVRHRLASFSQESQRYVNYGNRGLEFVRPLWTDERLLGEWDNTLRRGTEDEDVHEIIDHADYRWLTNMICADADYAALLSAGRRPEEAREVLPNSTKTEIVVSANAREWRHILKLRTSGAAHPEMRRLMVPLLNDLKDLAGPLFNDINNEAE